MAFYVMLVKVNEDEQGVTYNFGTDPENLGKIHLDKDNGKFKKLKLFIMTIISIFSPEQ